MLVLWFSISPRAMLIYNAITLRDILYVRMGMFSSRFILDILRNTLYTIKGFLFRLNRGITKSEVDWCRFNRSLSCEITMPGQ